MSLHDAFVSADDVYREQVMRDTWGHLACKRNKTYRGFIVFAIGCFGSDHLNPTVLACEFGDLDSSPWFFDAVQDFIGADENLGEEGSVYRFDGTLRNYRFKGTIKRVFRALAEEQK